MQASNIADRTASGLLVVTQSLLGGTENLALQPAQRLPSVTQQVTRLLLHLTDKGFDRTVDLVCVHAGLSLEL